MKTEIGKVAQTILWRGVIVDGEKTRVTRIYSMRRGNVTVILGDVEQFTFPLHVFNHNRPVKFRTSGKLFEI